MGTSETAARVVGSGVVDVVDGVVGAGLDEIGSTSTVVAGGSGDDVGNGHWGCGCG